MSCKNSYISIHRFFFGQFVFNFQSKPGTFREPRKTFPCRAYERGYSSTEAALTILSLQVRTLPMDRGAWWDTVHGVSNSPCWKRVNFLLAYFWPCRTAFRILVPHQGSNPVLPAVEVQSLHHWTPREVPGVNLSKPVWNQKKIFYTRHKDKELK